MRTFRLRRASVAMALIAGVAGGAQIAGMRPAVAQVPAFVITATQTPAFDIKAGEKVPLAKIFNIQQAVSGAQISVIKVASDPSVQINGLPGSALGELGFSNLNGLLAATVTVTKTGALGIRIFARNAPTDSTESISYGGAVLRIVEPPGIPAQAIGIVPLASPPAVSGGEKVPLGRFLTTNVFFGPPTILSIAFQTSGGVQLNGSSSGALPPVLEAIAAASVTASSDGGLTILIDYTAVSPGGGTVPQPFQTQGSILVRFNAPVPAPAPGPAPPPPAGGVPAVGGGNRAPVAQSMALIAVAGAVSPLVLQGSDPDGNALTFVVTQFPAHGKLSGQAPNLSYTPDRGFVGIDALIFTASDGTASSAQATVTITVTGKAASIAKTIRKVAKKTVKKTTKKR